MTGALAPDMFRGDLLAGGQEPPRKQQLPPPPGRRGHGSAGASGAPGSAAEPAAARGGGPALGERASGGNAWHASMARTDVKHGRFSGAEKATLRAAVDVRGPRSR